jgi:hypothetical protein
MGMTDTASRLIAKFGQQATIEREGNPPVNPWDPPGTTVSHPCTVAVVRYQFDYMDGTLIERDDRRVFLSVERLTIEPETSDRLVIDGVTYSLVSIHPLAPDGVVRFYELQARA